MRSKKLRNLHNALTVILAFAFLLMFLLLVAQLELPAIVIGVLGAIVYIVGSGYIIAKTL